MSSDVTSVEHLTLVVTKHTRATTIGIRLQDGYHGLEITDVFANGPLAGIVQEGDVLVAIDGVACLSGHEKAIQCLREKVGDVILTVKPSQPQRLQSLTAIPLDAGGEVNLAAPSLRMRHSSSRPLHTAGETESFQREIPVTAAAEAMLKGVYSETLMVCVQLGSAGHIRSDVLYISTSAPPARFPQRTHRHQCP